MRGHKPPLSLPSPLNATPDFTPDWLQQTYIIHTLHHKRKKNYELLRRNNFTKKQKHFDSVESLFMTGINMSHVTVFFHC